MAFAHDWDEIRLPLALNVFFGVTLGIAVLVYWGDYNFTRITYLGFCIGLTIILGFFYWRQERARPARAALGAPAPSPAT